MNTEELDQSREGVIRAWFDYNPETGEIWWKEWVSPDWYERKGYHTNFMRDRAGKPVNFQKTTQGHLCTRVRNTDGVYAHHIAWVLSYGKLPKYHIDHIDGNPENNAIKNLRDVPKKINSRNQKMSRLNTSGATGVYWHAPRKKWRARVCIDGKSKSLGCYTTVEEAAKARKDFLYENAHLGFTERHGQKQ